MHELAFLLQTQFNTDTVQRGATMLVGMMGIVAIVVLVLVILPFWFICKKAGFTPWLSLLFLIPFGGVVLVYVLAFAEWKVVPAAQAMWTSQQFPPQPPATQLPPQV